MNALSAWTYEHRIKQAIVESEGPSRVRGPQIPAPKLIGYSRVSTEEQRSSVVSLDAQADRIAAFCKAQGFEPVLVPFRLYPASSQRMNRLVAAKPREVSRSPGPISGFRTSGKS